MEIKYLKTLQQNPKSDMSQILGGNRPMSTTKIQQLQQLWNNGNPFPIVLLEFLSLAGDFCWIFEGEQELMKEEIDSWSQSVNFPITRPFVAMHRSISDPQFFIVFLDEDQIDPTIYELLLYEDYEMDSWGDSDHPSQRLINRGIKLSDFINGSIKNYRNWQQKGLL